MPTTRFVSDNSDLDLFYKDLAEHDLQPLWELPGLMTAQPAVRSVPFVWHAAELGPLAARAGELVSVDRGGDRRVLACSNPGLDGAPYAVGTLWAAVQYLGVGEVARAHRHTPAALRFVLEGAGVWTLVEGDAIPMSAGDLVLTPSWTFHEHHNSGGKPMMWLDVLDLPVVVALDAVFFEPGPAVGAVITTPEVSRSEQRFGSGPGLVALGDGTPPTTGSPLLAYRWADTDRALEAQLAGGAHVGHVRYTDPTTGADVMPTMRCEMMRIPAGVTSPRTRQTGSRVACVLHGSGTATVAGEVFELSPGDIVAIPSWQAMSMAAAEDIDLFITSDAPILASLALYREETVRYPPPQLRSDDS